MSTFICVKRGVRSDQKWPLETHFNAGWRHTRSELFTCDRITQEGFLKPGGNGAKRVDFYLALKKKDNPPFPHQLQPVSVLEHIAIMQPPPATEKDGSGGSAEPTKSLT